MNRLRRRAGLPQHLGAEDGAIAVLASVLLLVSLAASALAVDVGALALEQREMRKVADLAALDAVLVLSDRSGEFPDAQAGAVQVAERTAKANGLENGVNGTLVTRVGHWNGSVFLPGIADANAVEVTASDEVGFQFAPGSRVASATAIAQTESEGVAGIAIGTGLASLDSKESALLNPLLSRMLETSLDLDAVHYEGLANLDVPIGLLATHLGVTAGAIDELLATEVSVAELAQAFADANPDEFGAAAQALGVLAALNMGPATVKFPLGDILDIAASTVTGDAFADAEVNALTMLMAAAQAANRNNAVDINVGAFLPSLSGGDLVSSTLTLVVIEPPQIAIGPARRGEDGDWVTVARSAQVRLRVRNSVNLTSALISPLLATGALQLPLYVDAAKGEAALTANHCGDPGQLTTDVTTSGVNLRIANPTDAQLVSGAAPTGWVRLVTLRTLLLGNVAHVEGRANVTVGAGAATRDFDGPFNWDNQQHVSFTSDPKAALLADLDVEERLLGLSLTSTLLSAITGTVANIETLSNGLLTGLTSEVLNPALSLLGADLAGADVTAWHQECGAGSRILVQ